MKIRDLILTVLAAGIVISAGILVGFVARQINDIEAVTSEASADVLVDTANENLKNIAVGIRDSLDSQMQNQYEMVRTWAQAPTLLDAAQEAQNFTMEELYEMWSAESGREYDEGEAVGDGNPSNDLDPAASNYLAALANSTAFPEIFITDHRGYAIAANGATGDFDQGPDDWRFFQEKGYVKHKPAEGGEGWYRDANSSEDGFFVGEVEWDNSAASWGIDTVSQMKDPASDAYLGQIKAVFNYGSFIDQFVATEELDVFEIKVVNQDGVIVATSLESKDKVNNEGVTVVDSEYFKAVKGGATSGFVAESEIDENSNEVHAGYAVSSDVNQHIIVVSKKEADVASPINAFVGDLRSKISAAGTALQTNMILVAIIVAVVNLFVAFFIMRAKITAPLQKLTAVSNKLSMGEIDGLEIDVRGSDEIGQFGERFQGVLAAFNLLKEEAERTAEAD
ncbi:MAG: hypothetical protein ACE5Q6_15175 [Dehalococcoidia bacterium]